MPTCNVLCVSCTLLPTGGTGSLLAMLGGAPFGTAGFSIEPGQAVSAAAVLRTPTVYERSDGVHDRDVILVAVQLRDGAGSTQVSTTGLRVALYLSVITAELVSQMFVSQVCRLRTQQPQV